MLELERKRRLWRLLYSRVSIGILVIILFFSVRATWGVYQKYQSADENRRIITEELQALEQREAIIAGDIARLETPVGKEGEIREKLGLVKEGEGVIIIVDEEIATEAVPAKNFNVLLKVWQAIKAVFRF